MPTLARIRVHPIKALDPMDVETVDVSSAGGLRGDRGYAVVDAAGEYVNGKRTDAVHRLRADVDLDDWTVRIGERGGDDSDAPGTSLREFELPRERADLAGWLSEYLGYEVHLESAPGGGLTDSSVLGGAEPGVTLVSTTTLESVASWFPDLDVENVRRRFRANLEVEGVPPFWEDRLFEDGGIRFRIGDVAFRGVEPVPRCVVPTRDPDTGEPTDGFRERFVEKREETFPGWIDHDALDHSNVLTVLARPGEDDRGESLRVGDSVEVLD